MLAPIVLFVYNRPEHTQKTLQALKENELASQSELYIFSDGPKDEKNAGKIYEVRKILRTWKERGDFLNVYISEAKTNRGLANSVIDGVSQIIGKYGKVIVLEDDIVTDAMFLTYMNQALDYYEKNDRIWSVSGYVMPMKSLKKYSKDVFFFYRGCSWGWGTWKDRWDMNDWDMSVYYDFRKDRQGVKQFERGGKDLPRMMEWQIKGKIDSWAVRWYYWQSKYDMFTVYPRVSLVENTGCDGTGTHTSNKDIYGRSISKEKKKELQLEQLELNRKVTKEFWEICSATLWFRVKRKLEKILKLLKV